MDTSEASVNELAGLRAIKQYLSALDTGALTLDDVIQHSGLDRETCIQIHGVLTWISDRLVGRTELEKLFRSIDERSVIDDLIDSLRNKLAATQDYSDKELTTALNSAIKTAINLREQADKVNQEWKNTDGLRVCLGIVFQVLSRVDPIVAMRCRDAVTARFNSLVAMVPGVD